MSAAIRVEAAAGLATVIIDRPPLNILDLAALAELESALTRLGGDESLQLLIVRGAGLRAFSAGVSVQDHSTDNIECMLASFHSGLKRLLDFPTPTLAAIDGHCLGGGMELAAACDLRFATETSRFGQPEIELGCYPPWAAAHYPDLLGPGITADLLLTGRIFEASEARQLGFVDRVVAANAIEDEVAAFADQITGHSTAVTRLAVRAIRARRRRNFADALAECERLYIEELTQTQDMTEGLTAFLEKRPPVWQNQ